jgi:hypothetical protein
MSYRTNQIFREFGFIQEGDATEEARSRSRRPNVASEKRRLAKSRLFLSGDGSVRR